MRGLNRVVALDPRGRIARVQTGACWRDLQGAIDPHDLSVKIMQSYADFTIGGALSVNCHGRYVGAGPVVNSVRRIALVLADGRIVEASRTENADLFHGAIGGYGGLGIVVEADLDLVPNTRVERHVRRLPLADYPDFFRNEVRLRPGAVLHNADIDLQDFGQVTAITWSRTERGLTQSARLHPADERYGWDRAKLWALGHVPAAQMLRRSVVDPLDHAARPVVWRNYQASLGVSSLGQISGSDHSHVLQEYFVPVDRFQSFARDLAAILARNQVQALNISIRHAPADSGTLLTWAPQEVFCLVLYYRQATTPRARAHVRDWTRQAIAAALAHGGRYYLPYQLHATPAQFRAAYPGAGRFLALKKSLDPANRFRNKLLDAYLA